MEAVGSVSAHKIVTTTLEEIEFVDIRTSIINMEDR
jgi:hypothetical protein